MPKRIAVDYTKLLKMMDDGVPQAEIMNALGLKTATQFKVAIANAAMDAGKIPSLVGGRGAGKSGTSAKKDTAKVGKRGTIILPKEVVESYGYKEGDSFDISQTKSGIKLKKS